MAKFQNSILFSEHFQINVSVLNSLGVLNISLNLDIPLFIDPLLLAKSQHEEIRNNGRKNYVDFFKQVIKLLKASKVIDDVPWRNAKRKMKFPEIKGTCLGYSVQSVSGSGSGSFITEHLLRTAKQIVDLGVEDPDLFIAMGLFEEGIGPDRISDMVTNIIRLDLALFTSRITNELGIPTRPISFCTQTGESIEINLPLNPFQKDNEPILLVPHDILRELPIVKSWSDIAQAASKNESLRKRVNNEIGDIWKKEAHKTNLKNKVLSNLPSFETLLELIHQPSLLKAYDTTNDPKGLLLREEFHRIIEKNPCVIPQPIQKDSEGLTKIVEEIIEQFRFLIEDRRISEQLYNKDNVRPENCAQAFFYTAAYHYCRANNIDITPEAGTGNGPVDFKFSQGFDSRILVEIKLSVNNKLISGYTKQLSTYGKAEETIQCYYLVIDVGNDDKGKILQKLLNLRNAELTAGRHAPEIKIIDGKRRSSASHL